MGEKLSLKKVRLERYSGMYGIALLPLNILDDVCVKNFALAPEGENLYFLDGGSIEKNKPHHLLHSALEKGLPNELSSIIKWD